MKTVVLIIIGIVILLAAGFLLTRNRAGQSKSQVETFSILQGNIDGRPMFACKFGKRLPSGTLTH
jgi:hypothetical protein